MADGFALGKTLAGEPLALDPRDLTTHGVIVGMTGSGKTGLGLILLEEALSAGIPVLALDPKGDLGNLLLTFPDLAPADFAPWVESGDGASAAEQWAEGLKSWGIDGSRIQAMRDAGDLLEWAEVHGNFYGTPREPVEQAMAEGRDMLFDIDWQGALQLQEKMKADVVSIFVLPPSMTELQSRLHRRAEDSEEVIRTRLLNSRAEIEHWREYDYVIVNDDLDEAFGYVSCIVKAERIRRDRRYGLFDFVEGLLQEEPKL